MESNILTHDVGGLDRPLDWVVYMLECSDSTYYTGVTNDIDARLVAHNAGRGSRYVRSRRPARIVWTESAKDRGAALRREAEIKRMTKAAKAALVHGGVHGRRP